MLLLLNEDTARKPKFMKEKNLRLCPFHVGMLSVPKYHGHVICAVHEIKSYLGLSSITHERLVLKLFILSFVGEFCELLITTLLTWFQFTFRKKFPFSNRQAIPSECSLLIAVLVLHAIPPKESFHPIKRLHFLPE